MKAKIFVRFVSLGSSANLDELKQTMEGALRREGKLLQRDPDYSWSISERASIREIRNKKHFRDGEFRYAFALDVFIGVDRRVTTEAKNHLEESDFREYEQATVFLFLDQGVLVVFNPELRTKAQTIGGIVGMVAKTTQRFFVRNGVEKFDLSVPRGKRRKSFFVRKLLEAAESDKKRVTSVSVSALHDSKLSDTLMLFNPDIDLEEIGRIFLPKANEKVGSATTNAIKGGDLSHNPLVRGQIGAGIPRTMKIEETVDDKTEKRIFHEDVTDQTNVEVRRKDPSMLAWMIAIVKSVRSGIFDNE